KVQVGLTVTNAQIKFFLAPRAQNDAYLAAPGRPLSLPAPGVLANDFPGWGTNLTALLLTAPTNGALSLNANGAFTYTPVAGFTGADAFTYPVTDGVTNSNPATVSLLVGSSDAFFWDNFVRPTDPAPVAPWVIQSGNCLATGGFLQSGSNPLNAYALTYITNSWTNYQVQARIRFP